jgi:chloramphenicol 3-O phosphotransferase
MAYDVVMLNGASSAGKSSLARALQELIPEPWLTFGIDTLITAMPFKLTGAPEGLVFHDDGRIDVGPTFAALEADWRRAIGAMARGGMKIIVDEVMLRGGADQISWRAALKGLSVLWVGVRCDVSVATAREKARGDRVVGMSATQAELAHAGIVYDIEVDTTQTPAGDCARSILAHMRGA